MKDKKTAVDEAFRAIYHGTATKAGEVEQILKDLWDAASERAGFEHQMAVMAYHFAQAIDARGPQLVAERIGITVEELVERLKPERFAELTMSELLLLSISAEVSHDVIVLKKEPLDQIRIETR